MKTSLGLLLVAACSLVGLAQPTVIATGLQSPAKLILTPSGNMLVSETSLNPNAGRISYVTRAGTRRSLFESMPSGTDVVGGGAGPSAMALNGRRLYISTGPGDIERMGATPGTSIHNPAGVSSPIFCSILQADFSQDIDVVGGTFQMTPQHGRTLADGNAVELSDGAGSTARLSLLARFPISEPDPNLIYRFSNPWGIALSPDGLTLYVTDASTNSLAAVDTTTGRWRRIVRFPPSMNPGPVGPPVLDAVPTSVRIYGDQLLVSFLSGFPFVNQGTRVSVVTPSTGTVEPFLNFLTSAVDVLWRTRSNGQRQFFALEFSTNQAATPAAPGRLIRYDTYEGQVMIEDLRAPVSLAYDPATQDLLILELTGRILQLRLN